MYKVFENNLAQKNWQLGSLTSCGCKSVILWKKIQDYFSFLQRGFILSQKFFASGKYFVPELEVEMAQINDKH